MKLEKRIGALEQRLLTDPIILHMPDGTERRIRGDVQHRLGLFCTAARQRYAQICGDELQQSEYDAELGLIARAKTIDEGGGSLIRFVHDLCNEEKEP